MNLILFDPGEWGKDLGIRDERAVHIREILKPEVGDALRVGLRGGGIGSAHYLGLAQGSLRLDFPAKESLRPGPDLLNVTIVLAHPRPPVLQRVLKDFSSMGIARTFVFQSELSEKSYFQSRIWSEADAGHYSRFLMQGAQQGGFTSLGEVRRFWRMSDAVEAIPPAATRLVLDLAAPGSYLGFCAGLASGQTAAQGEGFAIAIGPERGWTDGERAALAKEGFSGVGLGSRTLRTETACILAAGMITCALDRSSSGADPDAD